MARNRKRAKERRSRRPAGGQQQSRPGVATRPEREVTRPDPADEQLDNGTLPGGQGPELDEPELEEPEIPAALEHAAPDVELADAQIALGRAQADAEAPVLPDADDYDQTQALSDEEFEDAAATADEAPAGRAGRQLATADSAAVGHRSYPGHRLVNFLQGSWRELQRVQWPDRRQVVQATGVVIGFVIVAGVYLGIADTLSTKIVNFLLK